MELPIHSMLLQTYKIYHNRLVLWLLKYTIQELYASIYRNKKQPLFDTVKYEEKICHKYPITCFIINSYISYPFLL